MIRDTRIEYPPEYDEPDPSEWEGARLGEICAEYGIEPAADALRAIDKYGSEGGTVSVKLPNGERLMVPDDLGKIRELAADEPVAAWIVHGIAWDGSDWEWSEEQPVTEKLHESLQRFADALEEWQAFNETENDDA